MEVGKLIMYVFLILFGIGLFVYLQGFVQTLDMSGWTFGGASFVRTVIPAMPMIFLVVLIVIPVYFVVEEVRE
jgi:hypothetical protein